MQLFIVRRPSAWDSPQALEVAGAEAARVASEEMPDRVRWIHSHVVNEADGRFGTFCLFEAKDGAAIREHARRAGIPGEEFYPIASPATARSDLPEAASPS